MSNKATIALCMIVKDDTEAKILERCLGSFMPHVDGLYVAVTGPSGKHKKIHSLVKKHGGKSISTTPKTHPQIYLKKDDKYIFAHFAEARNVSFDMVDKEYDYLTWADVDDVITSGEELKVCAEMAKEKGYDGVFFTYYYALKFDKDGNPIDVIIEHLRERLLRPNKYKWISRLHEVAVPRDENFQPKQTQWEVSDTKRCVWVHLSDSDRFDVALVRNAEILEQQVKEEQETDPRTLFSLAKVYFDMGGEEKLNESLRLLKKYMTLSGWDAERANALEYAGLTYDKLGDKKKAIETFHRATLEYPMHILPYLRLSSLYFDVGQTDFAKQWLDFAMTMEVGGASTTISNPHEIKLLAATLKLREAQVDGLTKQMVYWAGVRKNLLGYDDGLYKAMEDHDYINEAARGFFNYTKWLKDNGYGKSVKRALESLPGELGQLPFVRTIQNDIGDPYEWGDDTIVYCAHWGLPHFEKWDWQSMKKGIGGSETAVISLTERWQKSGYKVTVYADVEEETTSPNGVVWKPFYTMNYKDKFNILVLWRTPFMLDKIESAKKVLVDLHDVASQLDWTKERMDMVDKVMFKSEYHRNNVPDLPDDKAVVISNGILV